MEIVAERPKTRGLLRRPTNYPPVTWLALATALVILILYPVAWLVFQSVQGDAGELTLANYLTVATSQRFRVPAINSLILATSVGVLSVLVASPMAWAVSRTDMPLRRLVRVMVYGSFVSSGFMMAMSWIILAGPNAGMLNRVRIALLGGAQGTFNIFSLAGVIFVTFLEVYPFTFILVSSGLSLVPAEMEDAANILGSSVSRTMLSITLPLVLPAILAGFILSFLEGLVAFAVPAMIGIPAQVYMLTTQIWALFQFPMRLGVASALALPLLLATLVLLWLQRRLIGRRNFATLTGKGGERRLVHLHRARWPLLAFCLFVVGISVVLPYAVLFAFAMTRAWGQPLGLDNLTLDNFRLVLFGIDAVRRAIGNSLTLATMAATAAVVFGALIAFIVERRLVRGASALAFLAMAPMVIPGIVFAVGLFASYSRPPLILYGTLWILFVAYLTKFLPFAFMTAATALRSVHPELEEAARVLGAGHLRAFAQIIAPLMRHGILSGWLIVFIFSLREMNSSILLFTSRTNVISVTVLDLYESGSWQAMAALSCVLLTINLVVLAIVSRLMGGEFLSRSRL